MLKTKKSSKLNLIFNLIKKRLALILKTRSPEIIVDILSIERNYALVQANVIGGPNEKHLPSRTIDNVSSSWNQ